VIPHFLKRSLSARLSAAFLSVSVGTVLVATLVSYQQAGAALRDRLRERLEGMSDGTVREVAAWLERHRRTLELLATNAGTARAVAPGETARALSLFSGVDAATFSATEFLLIEAPGGRVAHSSDSTSVGRYVVNQLYYREGRLATFLQPVYPDERSGRPTITLSTPVRDAGGTVRAVLAAHLDLRSLESDIVEPTAPLRTDAYLVNRYAEFVSADRFGRPEHRRGVHSVAIDSVITGRSGTGLYTDYDGTDVIGAWRWIPALEVGLILEAPQELAFAPARRLLATSLALGILAAALLTFGIVLIARRLTAPILEIAAAAERVAGGDFAVTAPVRSSDEIGQLAASFNDMTGRLRMAYDELGAQVIATRQALNAAQISRALMQDVVDNAPALVIVVGLDDGIRLANARLTEIAGVPAERIVGARLADLPGTFGAALAPLIARARTRDAAVEREVELGAVGEPHTWQSVAFPLRDDDMTTYAIGVVATDLTERARAEGERRERDASVQQAQKLESLGIMAGGIAHDFNNILGAIRGNVDLAQASMDDPNEIRDALEQIDVASRRAAELTRQMLAYAGRASLRREIVDLRRVVEDIVPLVRASQSKLIEITVAPMPERLVVDADPAQVSQVALNLLTNAAEAIGDRAGHVRLSAGLGGPPPPLQGELPRDASERWVCLTVQDSGEGMGPEVRARIFDPFFSTKSSGRGLGLSAVRGILRSTGGALRLQSTPGAGSTFDVFLPASSGSMRIVEPPSVTPAEERTGTVLIVDDEEALRRVTRRVIEMTGLRVLEAVDGADGLRRFQEYGDAISLVVLDLTMPGMGGIELLGEIRKLAPELPVIIASGYDRSDELTSAAPDSCTRFLQKPFGISALRDLLNEMLAARRVA
jgi:PAS domain S-box-containing protein